MSEYVKDWEKCPKCHHTKFNDFGFDGIECKDCGEFIEGIQRDGWDVLQDIWKDRLMKGVK